MLYAVLFGFFNDNSAAESDAAAPWYISIFTTLVPTVATIFDPPLATPRESTLAHRTMSHTG